MNEIFEPAPYPFDGGIVLSSAQRTRDNRVRRAPATERLFVELRPGDRPAVRLGARVAQYQQISDGMVLNHAPVAGRVVDILERPAINGRRAPAIAIEPNGDDTCLPFDPIANITTTPHNALIERVRAAGLVGMGGGGFPAWIKLEAATRSGATTLLINAAECEPGCSADTALLHADAAGVLAGALVVAYLIGAQRCLIGVDANNASAMADLSAALASVADDDTFDSTIWRCHSLPNRYPAGSERALVRMLTGIALAPAERPANRGIVCFNVATLHGIARAIYHGEPSTTRILSITGSDAVDVGNIWAPVGQPIFELATTARESDTGVLHGGPLTGWPVDPAVAVGKATIGLHFTDLGGPDPEPAAVPCIRCQRCAEACPEALLPERLLRTATSIEHAVGGSLTLPTAELQLCIECGACDVVCPSHIPLLAIFREAKSRSRTALAIELDAATARDRHAHHAARQQRRLHRAELARNARLRRLGNDHGHA